MKVHPIAQVCYISICKKNCRIINYFLENENPVACGANKVTIILAGLGSISKYEIPKK